MGHSQDDHLSPPDHVGDVVLTESRSEIDSTSRTSSKIEKLRIRLNRINIAIKCLLKSEGKLAMVTFIDLCVVANRLVELFTSRW
jgi:hypothetical protein